MKCVTIDEVVASRGLTGPLLIKADVQGAELRVLSGAEKSLEQTEAVILEVVFFEYFAGGPLMDEVVAWMGQHGFIAYDLCGLLYRALDNALSQCDILFVRKDGLLRKEHVYASPQQRLVDTRAHLSRLGRNGERR